MQFHGSAARRFPFPFLTGAVVALVLHGTAGAAGQATEELAPCSKCISPIIFSESGIGSANAVDEARITRAGIRQWCASWQPDDKACVQQQLAGEDLKKVYRARADCSAGKITPIGGQTYQLAGVWDKSDSGAGRGKWRDKSGKVVGRDNASGGLSIS